MRSKVLDYVVNGVIFWGILSTVNWIMGFEFSVILGIAMAMSFITVDGKKDENISNT